MRDWTQTFSKELWIKPDHTGADDARFIMDALRLRKGDRVLDAPCGAGRIAVHLAHFGCEVTGIDLQPSFVQRAKARFRKERVRGRFASCDLREMDFHREFDAAYSWNGSFGYFDDLENLDTLRRYAEALRAGGRLLVDQPNRENLLRHFKPICSNDAVTMKNRWCSQSQRVESDWIVKRNGKQHHNRMSIRLYTPHQMRSLFEQCGLRVQKLYGSITGEAYRRGSSRLIVVGVRR